MKKFRRSKAVGKTSAVALVAATLVFAVASASTQSPTPVKPGAGFTITSAISSSATSQIPALLYPGTQRYLWYTAHNTLKVPVTVTSLGISSVTPPTGCSISNLDYSGTTFTGSLVVPAMSTNSVPVPISLVETRTNQDTCENKIFNFTYSGSAKYTEVYATATTVTSSLNPSKVGQSVTYTASVTATATSSQDPVPSSPTGTVTFKDGATTACTGVAVSSTGTTTATATCSPPAYLAAGTHPITAIYTNTDGNFSGSTSPVLSQVVQATQRATSTALVSAPNPSSLGDWVTLSATVTKSSGSGTPSGTVSFYLGTPGGTHTLLGTATLNSSAKATFNTSSLPAGTDSLYAVYGGDTVFSTSTSPVIAQVVVALPGNCNRHYSNVIIGDPGHVFINATNGSDFVYAFGANYWVNGFNGDDCLDVGDGNNVVTDGNGDDVVLAGNGNNTIAVGNGDDRVIAGNGANSVGAGNGDDSVTIGNGSHSGIILGNGDDSVWVGGGSYNNVTLGNGTDNVTLGAGSYNNVTLGNGADVVTIQGGSHDTINNGWGDRDGDNDGDNDANGHGTGHGNGNVTIYLGSGTYNTFNGADHHTNVCHLPAPPSSWYGTAAAYYHDTIINCTVVTP